MSIPETFIERNEAFAKGYTLADLPALPKLRTVLITCADARVDPAHLFGLELGEVVIIRNTGGRVTREVIEEIAILSFMVAKMVGDENAAFDIVLMQHTQCGAQRLADPQFKAALQNNMGIDVSSVAITDHKASLKEDIERLRSATVVPGYHTVSALLYDVEDGKVSEVVAPTKLDS